MTDRRRTGVLVGLVVLASVVAGTVAGAASAASATQSDEPAFVEDVVVTNAGGDATIEVIEPTPANESVTVTVGDADDNFEATASVDDADGDDRVTIVLDTGYAGNGDAGSYVSVAGADRLVETSQHTPTLNRQLDAGNYELAVGGTAEDPADIGTLSIKASEANVVTASNGSSANTTFDAEGERLVLTASRGERIAGTTDLAAGTTVTVQAMSVETWSPFLVSDHVTVAENGSFAATFDFSDLPNETAVEVVARSDGERLARIDGVVVTCSDDCVDPADWPRFETPIVDGTAGTTVEIPVRIPAANGHRTNVTLGQAADNFAVRATLTDGDGDGTVVLALDTAEAGNGSPADYLSVTGEADALSNLEQTTPVREGGLDAGNYDLFVGPRDAPYDATVLALTGENASNGDGPATVETTGEVTFVTAGDTLRLGNVADQRIYGETSLPENATITIRIVSADSTEPFLVTPEANVTGYGTFEASVDLQAMPPDTPLEVRATHDGETVGYTLGRVVDCSGGCPEVANDHAPNGSADGGAVTSNGSSAANDTPNNGSADAAANAGGDGENRVTVEGGDASLPLVGIGALGLGGLLSLLGVARFTGYLGR